MIRKVLGAIRKQGLVRAGDTVLVAVSGGADSVGLLRALHELRPALKIQLAVAHLNHGLRGKASDADADFVRRLAAERALPVHVARRDIRRLAHERALSLEMAAREARYAFLARVASRTGADAVATGHTADDQAETVVLRLARGAGPHGLAGISPSRTVQGIRIVRPLLSVRRKDIERYLNQRGATWREDASNTDTAFVRNRVRHEVLPLLRARLNPDIDAALCRNAEILADENAWIDELAATILDNIGVGESGDALDVRALQDQPLAVQRRVLRLWLTRQGVDTAHLSRELMRQLEGLVARRTGSASLSIPGGPVVDREYATLTTRDPADGTVSAPALPPQARRYRLTVPGETLLPEWGLRVTIQRAPGIQRPRPTQPGRLPAAASLDAARVGRRALWLRAWQPGDRMRPLGLDGSKKLQDIFVDTRVPAARRHIVPIIICADEIVWLPGYRVARGWEVPSETGPALQVAIRRCSRKSVRAAG